MYRTPQGVVPHLGERLHIEKAKNRRRIESDRAGRNQPQSQQFYGQPCKYSFAARCTSSIEIAPLPLASAPRQFCNESLLR